MLCNGTSPLWNVFDEISFSPAAAAAAAPRGRTGLPPPRGRYTTSSPAKPRSVIAYLESK
jgi:hypothetical protein